MKKFVILALLTGTLLAGCAAMAGKSRLESYSQIVDAYEKALRRSDYNAAARFLDPSAPAARVDLHKMKDIKIVEYKVTRVNMSENKTEIAQDVELQYFRLNSNILRTVHDPQIWRFQQEGKVWLLQTGFPDLGP